MYCKRLFFALSLDANPNELPFYRLWSYRKVQHFFVDYALKVEKQFLLSTLLKNQARGSASSGLVRYRSVVISGGLFFGLEFRR